MSKPPSTAKERLALLRFEVICHIRTLRQDGTPLATCLRDASSRPWPDPHGCYYSYRTLETWWYDYAKRGYQGLTGTGLRLDSGKSRSIDETTGLWIIERLKANPDTPLLVLLRHWRSSEGRELPSESSIYRYLKAKGYDRRSLRAGRLDTGPQKAFEAPAPNDLWMVDYANGPTLRRPDGKSIATHLCVLIDDHSRLIPFGGYYPAGNTACFLHALKQAVLRRGLPHKLYTDQGKPFINHHVRTVCANLGIRLIHAKPYHAWSKGKVERLIGTIQRDFECSLRLEGHDVHSLEALNAAFSKWVDGTYHLRTHSSTAMSPHQRFTDGRHTLRPIEDPDQIDPLFYTRIARVVRKDGTVTLHSQLFEVPLALRSFKIELRYEPLVMDRIEVWYQNAFQGLARKTDLDLNSRTFNKGANYAR